MQNDRLTQSKLALKVLAIIAGLLGLGLYFGFRIYLDYSSRVIFEICYTGSPDSGCTKSGQETRPSPTPPPPPITPLPSPSPTATAQPAPKSDNVTGYWFSLRSKKTYFIHQDNYTIEMFEYDSQGRRMRVGKGTRFGEKLVIQFHSTIESVNGTLELVLSKDNKLMEGGFSAFNDSSKQGTVYLLRAEA